MAWSTPRTWSTGELVTAAIMNAHVRDNLNAAFPLGVDAWTVYTPTLTNITLGNGILIGKYHRVGRTIHFRIKLTWGTTTSSSGNHIFRLPVAPHADYTINAHVANLTLHDSGTAVWNGTGFITSGSDFLASYKSDTAATGVTATLPFTWTVNDQIFISGTYEAAS